MYLISRTITQPISNNRLDYERRTNHTLIIPSLVEGTLDDVKISENIVIECDVDGEIQSGKGLEHFIFLKNSRVPTWVIDNHNHAFYFWYEALEKEIIQKGSLLIHIDQHTDLGTPMKFLEKENNSLVEIYDYTNSVLTIADFIVPALRSGIISEAMMVTGEEKEGAGSFVWENDTLKKISSVEIPRTIIVDLDLDYFSQGFDEAKAMETVKYWIQRADIITIATSPLFIGQEEALRILKSLQKDLETL